MGPFNNLFSVGVKAGDFDGRGCYRDRVKSSELPICVLCGGNDLTFITTRKPELNYHRCGACDIIFLDERFRLPPEEERERYCLHENDPDDPRYREFLRPVYDSIRENVAAGAKGLDYGSGPTQAMAKILARDYTVVSFDPFFFPDPKRLEQTYDFITCSEVAEHFYNPAREFRKLKSLLNPDGVLACMTLFHTPEADFENWYYRRDPTHVTFYSSRSLRWIAENFGFKEFQLHGERVALFKT